MCIAFFYAVGTGLGGAIGPLLFGALINTKHVTPVFWGYTLAAGLMAVSGIVAAFMAVDAEGKQLEDIATPITAAEAEVVGGADEQKQPEAAETTQVEPRLEECILHGIGCVLVIAEDEPGGPEKPISPADRQCREGIEISAARPDHEVSLHRSTSDVAVVWPLCPVWGRSESVCSIFLESPGQPARRASGPSRDTRVPCHRVVM